MDNISPVILAVCGLSVVCIGLLAVVAFIVMRFTGGTLLAPLMGIISGIGGGDGEEDSDYMPRRPARRQPRTPSAQSARPPVGDDFDAAVERYRQQGQSGTGSSGSLGGTPGLRRGGQLSGDLSEPDEPLSGSLRRRSRRQVEDSEIYDDDEDDGGGLFDL